VTDAPAVAVAGGCGCGRVRYRATLATLDGYLCHCRMCQRATGSVSIAFVNTRQADVTWERPCDWHRSSPIAERGFCAVCGASLAFRYIDGPNIDLTVASLDDPSSVRCTSHFGVESRLEAWWHGTEGLPEERSDAYQPLIDRWEKAGATPPD